MIIFCWNLTIFNIHYDVFGKTALTLRIIFFLATAQTKESYKKTQQPTKKPPNTTSQVNNNYRVIAASTSLSCLLQADRIFCARSVQRYFASRGLRSGSGAVGYSSSSSRSMCRAGSAAAGPLGANDFWILSDLWCKDIGEEGCAGWLMIKCGSLERIPPRLSFLSSADGLQGGGVFRQGATFGVLEY